MKSVYTNIFFSFSLFLSVFFASKDNQIVSTNPNNTVVCKNEDSSSVYDSCHADVDNSDSNNDPDFNKVVSPNIDEDVISDSTSSDTVIGVVAIVCVRNPDSEVEISDEFSGEHSSETESTCVKNAEDSTSSESATDCTKNPTAPLLKDSEAVNDDKLGHDNLSSKNLTSSLQTDSNIDEKLNNLTLSDSCAIKKKASNENLTKTVAECDASEDKNIPNVTIPSTINTSTQTVSETPTTTI